jgi:hypothetical protein
VRPLGGGRGAASAALGTEAGSTLGFAWLLVVFAATHLLLDAAALYELAKTSDGFLNTFPIA